MNNEIDFNYISNKSRRDFLRIMGYSALGLTLNNFLACSPQKEKILRLYGTGTLDIEEIGWAQLKKDLDITLMFEDNNNDTGPVITQMISGTAAEDYHLGGLQGGAERELAEAGKIIPWDLNKIPNWDGLWEWAKSIPYTKVNGKQFGLPIVINADSIIYLPEKTKKILPETDGVIDSYSAVFDERFKGKTSMEDAWINSAIFTAIYLKENGIVDITDPGDLTLDELEQVMEFLIKKKKNGQFLTFWQGWEQGLDLILQENVWVMTGWEPIVYAARQAGKTVEYAVPKEGFEGWSNDLILHKGAETDGIVELAHQFANWELGGYYGCKLAELRGYVVPTDNAVKYSKNHPEMGFDPNQQYDIVENVRKKFQTMKGRVYWQNVRPKNYKEYEKWWNRLRNS